MHWVFLVLAVIGEVIGTSIMKIFVSDGYLVAGIFSATIAIGISYCLLSQATIKLPVALANAAWESLGMVFIACTSFLFLKENISTTQFAGIALALIGIAVVHRGYQHNDKQLA